MNVAVGLQTSARIYFEFAISIWALVNMGESMAMIFGSWIGIEGLTVTYVVQSSGPMYLNGPATDALNRVVSTLLSMVGQISGVISLSVPHWLAGIAWGFTVKRESSP
jgi:hypothetical protein